MPFHDLGVGDAFQLQEYMVIYSALAGKVVTTFSSMAEVNGHDLPISCTSVAETITLCARFDGAMARS